MSPKALRLIIGGTLAICLVPLLFLRDNEYPPQRAIPSSSPSKALASGATKPLSPLEMSGPASSSRPPRSPDFLGAKLRTTTNALVFAEEARRHPELGGYYYSSKVNSECTQFHQNQANLENATPGHGRLIGNIDGKAEHRRRRALEDLGRFCESYGPFGDPTESERILQGVQKGDRLLKPVTIIKSGLTENRSKALLDIMEFGDPNLLVEEGYNFFLETEKGYFLEGEWIPTSNGSILAAAAQLAGCDLGATCNEFNRIVRWRCVESYICTDNLEQLINETYKPDEIAKINSYRRRIERAFLQRNVNFFVP